MEGLSSINGHFIKVNAVNALSFHTLQRVNAMM